jgi:gamma-glutamyltranspeptidase/glutathione hydrolase
MRVAAATPSPAALEAALRVAAGGGGAVDAAVAAAAVAMVNEVAVCSPGSGGFVTVLDGAEAVVYDGYTAVPGLGDQPRARPHVTEVTMAYGGGVTTLVGPGSIGTPGIWAALDRAHGRHGRLAWAQVLAPAIALAGAGFTLGRASFIYLHHAHHIVFGHDQTSAGLLHRPDGTLMRQDDVLRLPDLARSLELLAADGASALHGGTLGAAIAEDLDDRGSRLTEADLALYSAEARPPIVIECGDWEFDTNPGPAIGGRALAAVLDALDSTDRSPHAHHLAQRSVFQRRARGQQLGSESTIHVSVVDEYGGACAITASSGYGSGVIPAGTGIWMNNALGELELVPSIDELVPGERLISNMAPTVGRHRNGSVMAIGSPGADRITSALSQVISAVACEGVALVEAIQRPRLHAVVGADAAVAIEPGIEIRADVPVRSYSAPHMYFGGVAAAMLHPDGSLQAVSDRRRDGAAGVSP